MVKHTQTIRRQIAFDQSVFDHFVGLALKGLKPFSKKVSRTIESHIVRLFQQEVY